MVCARRDTRWLAQVASGRAAYSTNGLVRWLRLVAERRNQLLVEQGRHGARVWLLRLLLLLLARRLLRLGLTHELARGRRQRKGPTRCRYQRVDCTGQRLGRNGSNGGHRLSGAVITINYYLIVVIAR